MTWHLLLDYDVDLAVPGAALEGVAFNDEQGRACVTTRVEVNAARWREIIGSRLALAGYKVTATSWERSSNGWHAKLELDPAPDTPLEVIALQAVCGSDPKREACNVQRARYVEANPARAAYRLIGALEGFQYLDDYDRITAANIVHMLRAELEAGKWRDPGMEFFAGRFNTLYRTNPNRKRKP